ncbi:MAG TPA: hypothetical protein VEM14_05780 [Gemmatimonadaceae bacterium]|nr:hypothetical protein [Gemmatimonadaceae bacterium]
MHNQTVTRWVQMFVIEPPYRIARLLSSIPSSPIQVGSLACGAASNLLQSLAELLRLLRINPWVVPSVIVSREQVPFVEAIIESMPSLQDRVAPVIPAVAHDRCPVAEVVAAVRSRVKPKEEVLAGYVSARLDAPELYSALECQFREALHGAAAPTDRSAATYCRLFQRYGKFTARDWRTIARLACHLAQSPRLANGAPSCWVRYAHRYLGTSLYSAMALLGWEWVIERALLRANYSLVSSSDGRCQTAQASARLSRRSVGAAL